MSDVKTPIQQLNGDCLRLIFLNLPVMDRVRLQSVCKKWRNASEDCWSAVRVLDLDMKSNAGEPPVSGVRDFVRITTKNKNIVQKILKNCGQFVTTLKENVNVNVAILSLLAKYCHNITKFEISPVKVSSRDLKLRRLFHANRNVTSIEIEGIGKHCCSCLEKLSLGGVEYCSIETDAILGSVVASIRDIVRDSSQLRHLAIDCANDEILNLIGQKINLTCLYVGFYTSCNLTTNGVDNILKLVNLKLLGIDTSRHQDVISDDFLVTLTKYCRLLEELRLKGCRKIPNKSVKSLADLKKLKHLSIDGSPDVTIDVFEKLPEIEFGKLIQHNSETGAHTVVECVRITTELPCQPL